MTNEGHFAYCKIHELDLVLKMLKAIEPENNRVMEIIIKLVEEELKSRI